LQPIFEIVKNKLAAFFLKEKVKGRLSQDANEERMADFCMPQYRAEYCWVRLREMANRLKQLLARR
jgi:hypothetical protein